MINLYENCRYGNLLCPDDTYIGAALEAYGEYSQVEADFLMSLLKPGDTVIEAGAHVGTLTMALAAAVGSEGSVYAYEPQPEIYGALQRNIETHACAMAVMGAFSDKQETLHFNANPANTGGVSLGAEGSDLVVTTTVDSLGLNRLDLMKIDVEGMETQVLEGARNTISSCRPIIYCENDRAAKSRALFDMLFNLGYRVWRHEPPLFNPNNFRGQELNVYPGVVSLNLVAIPEERDPPESVKGFIEVKPRQWAAVCRFGGVGDNLIAAGVLPDLVRQGNHVEVITNKHAGVVFDGNPWISKLSICEDDDQPGDLGLEWQKWFQKRGHEYGGRLYHLSHSVECQLALVPAQTSYWWPENLRRQMCNRSYLELAADICGTMHVFGQLFFPSRIEKAKALETKAKMGERVIAWVLEGSRLDKVYPYSAMAVARLIKEVGVPVMMVGSPGRDFELAKQIQIEVIKHNGDDKGLHLAMSSTDVNPNWPIRRSLAQALASDLVIGPDTGVMWAAAMESMPKIMLLSHASPENITKHWRNTVTLVADQSRVSCWPCHRLHDTIETCRPNADNTGAACISDISVELIVSQAKKALSCH